MRWAKTKKEPETVPYPGVAEAVDGSHAVVAAEILASDAAGAYPITPATQMGEGWAAAVAAGHRNAFGRKLVFFEPEGEHAAAGVTAGMSLTGMRSTNFSAGQGIAYMHESLYAAVGKRLTYVLNMACRAMTKQSLNVHAGHDDYHAVDDTGFFQIFAKDVQAAADLCLIAHRIAELSLNPGICAQDGFLTSHVIESVRLPEAELVRAYLGDPADLVDAPTPAQRLVFGARRRRIPEMFDFDYPAMLGVVQNQDSYAQGVAAQRPFYFDHVAELADRAFEEFARLTGRRHARASGYRLDDAEIVLVGQGSVVANAEAVADHLRATRRLKVGVLDLTMFRPFPADRVVELLRGARAVTVLERVDQPLAVDPPLLREIRAAFGQALENQRDGRAGHAGVPACPLEEVPSFHAACFGLGSRDLQPADLIAAVENMLPGGAGRRQVYLGIDFVRPQTRLPKLQIWQEQIQAAYPHLAELALARGADVDLMPSGSLSVRIHSVGGWGAITMGKNLALAASDLAGLYVKANPKYGSEKKGQPTTFYATLAPEPIRLNCELRHVDVVLAPDPNAFRTADPLAGLREGGVLVVQSDKPPADFWASLPQSAQHAIHERGVHLHVVDAFRIASEESSDPNLRYRMQGSAFLGAFFRTAPLLEQHGIDDETLFARLEAQLETKFGSRGRRVVEDNLRVIRRGHDEVVAVDVAALAESGRGNGQIPQRPEALAAKGAQPGLANGGRFWEQVCHLYRTGEDGIADPFAAISAMPAGSSAIRDMTDVRYEVPHFVAGKCTGCGQCWTQCPDSAIPGNVNTVEEVLHAGLAAAADGASFERLTPFVPHLARQVRKVLAGAPFTTFADVLGTAFEGLLAKLPLDPEGRAQVEHEFQALASALADFPLARTAPFFELPEESEKGSGGLLSITVNPRTCKGCNVCVEVCPTQALVTVRQDEAVVETLRQNWDVWRRLPSTADRYVSVASVEEGIGVLPSLLLKKENYLSMLGGDGACMGCGEKTAVHLVLTAVNALMQPRVATHVAHLETLMRRLDEKARSLLASDAELGRVGTAEGHVDIALEPAKQARVEHLSACLAQIEDLHWRYTEGPSGKGRALVGFSNSTGCSSVWGSTYPYNPYPFPWVNHLFQDAPSVAIGLFEGHMRKMARGFAAVRRAELELEDRYDPQEHEAFFEQFDWEQFTDEEFGLCPPVFAVGGDGAMLDIGFQNLSRLMTSGKPLRVLVLDTQVYSNTGGQACTSGFPGQVSDMAAFGPEQRGKQEIRKELALIAMAHREVYVLQSSQANASHLLGGVLRGLHSRRPAVFVLHCPCPPEHGLADDGANRAARLSLESRAFPLLVYDPDAGPTVADCLDLSGNPAPDETWPSYQLTWVDEEGNEQVMELPLTIADWAASEGRFKQHFRPLPEEAEAVPFHEVVAQAPADRDGRPAFVYALDAQRHLRRLAVSEEIVKLADERLAYWHALRQLAGLDVAPAAAARLERTLRQELERGVAEREKEREAELGAFKRDWSARVARRLAEGLLRSGEQDTTLGDLLERVRALPPVAAAPAEAAPAVEVPAAAPAVAVAPAPAAGPEAPAPAAEEDDEEESLAMAPWIASARCTSCNECINLNGRMFAYNDKKQATIKDPTAGTFQQLVLAAEKCPVRIIHPGTPLDPDEPDLERWVERAKPFR
jgi:pyruvate-ferredoxin/flavodoxin oxidoreductase